MTSSNVASVSARWGAAVRAKLGKAGLSITELAAELGVSRQHLTRTVDGSPTITVETYRSICDRLDLDPNSYIRTHESTPPWDSE